MATENELMKKLYYRGMLDETKQGHATQILGDMYKEKMQEPQPDLSAIRFAQGEVYFVNGDYEAAIFKWGFPMEELFPWAQKNIADAHMEMGLLDEAEKCYKQVETSSLMLETGVLVQLFSLYTEQERRDDAIRTIKEAVELNPDYPHVTENARIYFEDIEEWDHAIELVMNEALRTKSTFWMDILAGYVERGLTVTYEPAYFSELLEALCHLDRVRFERFVEILWQSYRKSNVYLEWIDVLNASLHEMESLETYDWEILPGLYEQGYEDLISGEYFIREIREVIQGLFPNWLQVLSEDKALIPATAVLAWNETFPGALRTEMVSQAEDLFESSHATDGVSTDGLALFEAIQIWAGQEGLLDDLLAQVGGMIDGSKLETESPVVIRDVVKASIEFLQEQKTQLEENEEQEINRNSGLLTSIHETHSQMDEMQNGLGPVVTSSFNKMKTSIIEEIKKELPPVLKECSSLIKEDSDFSSIQSDLNDEMNKRMGAYMDSFVEDYFEQSLQNWLKECQTQFDDSQVTMDALSHDINGRMIAEEIALKGDFKVLDDWQRDLERMSRSLLRMDKVNFMKRNTASQLFLKGAGKLFDTMSKSKENLLERYQSYIENTDFTPFVEKAIDSFTQQLDLFEESIIWDVEQFFKDAFERLNHEMERVQEEIEMHQNTLDNMRDQPEVYQNPLTLFGLRLRQYELIHMID